MMSPTLGSSGLQSRRWAAIGQTSIRAPPWGKGNTNTIKWTIFTPHPLRRPSSLSKCSLREPGLSHTLLIQSSVAYFPQQLPFVLWDILLLGVRASETQPGCWATGCFRTGEGEPWTPFNKHPWAGPKGPTWLSHHGGFGVILPGQTVP